MREKSKLKRRLPSYPGQPQVRWELGEQQQWEGWAAGHGREQWDQVHVAMLLDPEED